MMVELKQPHGDTTEQALRLLDDDAVIVSFQRRVIDEVRARRPKMRTVQHVGFGVSIRRAAGGWAVGFQDVRVTARGLAAARALGLAATVYTVNDETRMLELRDLGVGGIFTDRPDLALRTLRRAS
jgi:glycerophosphoryl diester phosphodiesterase